MLDLKNANKFAEEYNLDEKRIQGISILDSTLREGEQSPGIYLSDFTDTPLTFQS